jgi:hypothetical protein
MSLKSGLFSWGATGSLEHFITISPLLHDGRARGYGSIRTLPDFEGYPPKEKFQ